MINLKDLTFEELKAFLVENGEKPFRATQIFSWLHKGITSFDEMTSDDLKVLDKEAIQKAISAGIPFLATGNAMALFGSELTLDGEKTDALEAFSYKTEMTAKKRYLADALGKDPEGNLSVGFINTGCVYTGTDKPVMELLLGKKLGNDKASPAEGYRDGSFFGTQMIGPVLTKNPHLLSAFVKNITGEDYAPDPDSNLQKAYEIAKLCDHYKTR